MPPGARTNDGIMVLKSGVMVFQSGVMFFWRFIGGVMVLWCNGFLEPLFTLISMLNLQWSFAPKYRSCKPNSMRTYPTVKSCESHSKPPLRRLSNVPEWS